MRKIPPTMASQHPDHAGIPYWHTQAFISVQQEYKECFLSYADLGIDEYKWDWEGKLVDESLIERLLSQYYDYFKENQIGKDKFLTLRLPNPKVETEFRIGRAFLGLLSAEGLAKQLGNDSSPLFEVILPMTESAEEMIAIQVAFKEMTALKHSLYRFKHNKLTHLEVIPLFEQVQTIMNSAKLLQRYIILHKKIFGFIPSYMRPYVARSDPALNSGLVPTVLAIKVALSLYKEFTQKTGISLYPIIGSASLPFRGGLTPLTVDRFTKEYKGIRTALIQSAFRYDYDILQVKDAIKQLAQKIPHGISSNMTKAEETVIRGIIPFFESYYQKTIEGIAPVINTLAAFLPKRRERVQHIGLFGYSRGVGSVKLPRAIGFTAALYSLGVPPELIGTGRGLKEAKKLGKLGVVEKYYIYIKEDLLQAGKFFNKKNLTKLAKKSKAWEAILLDVKEIETYLNTPLGPTTQEEKEHEVITDKIYKLLSIDEEPSVYIEQAANLRKSLG